MEPQKYWNEQYGTACKIGITIIDLNEINKLKMSPLNTESDD